MMAVFIALIFAGTLLLLALRLQHRSSSDVLRDLAQNFSLMEQKGSPQQEKNAGFTLNINKDSTPTRLAQLQAQIWPILFGMLGVLWSMSQSRTFNFSQLAFAAFFGAALGFVVHRLRSAALEKARRREMEFFLPIVMERVVMAVQAGFDIVAALKRVVELEVNNNLRLDPVTRLLELVSRLCESGLGFEDSLRHVAASNPSFAVRHALIHLALAYKDGGEVVMPLTELSDSTQLYYQESVEEDIARMPVKATMPLVMTFAGLIVCFITAPLMQVLNIVSKAMPL